MIQLIMIFFLYKALEAYNFGPPLMNWIKMFYNDISSCVMNNGISTGYFSIQRGYDRGMPSVVTCLTLRLKFYVFSYKKERT